MGDNLLPRIEQILNGMTEVIAQAAEKIVPVAVNAIVSNAPQLLQSALSMVETIVSSLIENAPLLISSASTLVISFAKDIILFLPELIDAGFEIIFALADALIEALPELVPAIIDVVYTIVEKLTDPDTLMQLVDVAFELIGAMALGLIEAIPSLIEKGPEIIMNLVETLLKLGPKLVECGAKLLEQLGDGFYNSFGKIGEAIGNLWENLKEWFRGIIDSAVQWGKDLIDNFIAGIFGKKKDLEDAVSDSAQTVEDYIGFSQPKKGPLSDFSSYPADMIDLFDQGLRDNDYKLQEQLTASLSLKGLRQDVRQEDRPETTAVSGSAQQREPRQMTVVLMLREAEVARTVFRLNNEETQRVGLVLSGGAA